MRGLRLQAAADQATLTAAQQRWEIRSRQEDPANLKQERTKPQDVAERLPEDSGRAGLEQALRRLRTRASLLLIVAHPDDEDGGMLTYESRGQGARVGMLTLTRGEGGQNVVSGDFDDALGLVRTRELLSADRYSAVDQMFGTEADFGFSKTIEEAFSQWTHERVLYDAVRAVRLYRPLVLASVFIGGVTDGHGQHQVSGEITQEVFHAAADAHLFPEMNLPPWQPLKVYARVPFATIDQRGMYDYATGKYAPARFHNYVSNTWSTTPPVATVIIPEGDVDPVLGGKSYVQFAREGLALQRTQIGSGMRVPPAGRFDVGYTRYGAAKTVHLTAKETSFFDGTDTSLLGIATFAPSLSAPDASSLRQQLESLTGDVSAADQAFAKDDRPALAKALADGLRGIDATMAQLQASRSLPERERYDLLHELRVKRVQFNDALLLCLNVTMQAEVVTNDAERGTPVPLAGQHDQHVPRAAVPGQRLTVQTEITNSAGQPLRVHDETALYASAIHIIDSSPHRDGIELLQPGSTGAELLQADIAQDAPYSRPYFTRPDSEQPFYDLRDPKLRNAPVTPPALTAWETVWFGDVPLSLGATVKVPARTADKRSVRQNLTIVPPVSLAIDPKAGVIPEGQKSFELSVGIAAEIQHPAQGKVRLQLPPGWTSTPAEAAFTAQPGSQPQQLAFAITPRPPRSHSLQARRRRGLRRQAVSRRRHRRGVSRPHP